MTLSQIYSFISAQYPYYEANNRGWQVTIGDWRRRRKNFGVDALEFHPAQPQFESLFHSARSQGERIGQGKLLAFGSNLRGEADRSRLSTSKATWQFHDHLNECQQHQERVSRVRRRRHDHSFDCRSEENPSPTNQYINDASDFLLADLQTSNPSTPLSPMTSPLPSSVSPNRSHEEGKRKHDDEDDDDDDDDIHREVIELLRSLMAAIANEVHLSADATSVKRQKIEFLV